MKAASFRKSEFTFINLLKLYQYHKKAIIIFILSFLILTAVYSYIIPEKYQAIASVLPPEESASRGGLSGFLQSMAGGWNIPGGESGKSQIYRELIRSRELAVFIADSMNLKNESLFKIKGNDNLYMKILSMLSLDIARSGVMYISATVPTGYFPSSADKESASRLAAGIANKVIEGFDYINHRTNYSKASLRKEFIEKILVEKNKALDSVDAELQKFMENNKILAIDKQTQAVVGNAVDLGTQLAKAEIELRMKMQEYEPGSLVISSLHDKVSSLRQQYMRIQSGGISEGDKFSLPLANVPNLARQYQNLLRDQKILEQVKLYLETQRYQEAIEAQSDVPTVVALDKAIPPGKFSPNRNTMLLLGLIISLISALAFITVKAMIKGDIYVKKQEQQDFQDPVQI